MSMQLTEDDGGAAAAGGGDAGLGLPRGGEHDGGGPSRSPVGNRTFTNPIGTGTYYHGTRKVSKLSKSHDQLDGGTLAGKRLMA